MEELINKLYYILNNPLVTPWDLVENVKLDNYDNLHIAKGEQGITATIECRSDEGSTVEYVYYFDQQDHLMSLVLRDGYSDEIVFDRTKEIETAKSLIARQKKISTKAVAI